MEGALLDIASELDGGLIKMYFPGDPTEGAMVIGVVKEAGP